MKKGTGKPLTNTIKSFVAGVKGPVEVLEGEEFTVTVSYHIDPADVKKEPMYITCWNAGPFFQGTGFESS